MEYQDYFAALSGEDPALAEDLRPVRSLESVLGWMARRGLALGSADIIAQDEYSLDFVLPFDGDERHLVFGIT